MMIGKPSSHIRRALSTRTRRLRAEGFHATRPKKVYRADRSDKLWLTEHIEAFCAVASPQMRLALELALHTGQRQSDLLRLGWSSYDGQRISFRQGKRHRKIDMWPQPINQVDGSATKPQASPAVSMSAAEIASPGDLPPHRTNWNTG